MHKRIDAGTDIAMIGVWDACRSTPPLSDAKWQNSSEALDHDASEGHLFLIHTGGDGGGPVDVFVDEEMTEKLRGEVVPLKGIFLLQVPTGRIVVGGAEDYQASAPRITNNNSIVELPRGDYAIQCYAGKGEDEVDTDKDLAKHLGKENFQYYKRITSRLEKMFLTLFGVHLFLFFPVSLWLCFAFTKLGGWSIFMSIVICGASFLIAFYIFDRLISRDPRYLELQKNVSRLRFNIVNPTFVLVLRKVEGRAGMCGGSVTLE